MKKKKDDLEKFDYICEGQQEFEITEDMEVNAPEAMFKQML